MKIEILLNRINNDFKFKIMIPKESDLGNYNYLFTIESDDIYDDLEKLYKKIIELLKFIRDIIENYKTEF